MNIIGISAGFGPSCHDSSAALVCDGVLVAAAEEERFRREKHSEAPPLHSVNFCLQQANLKVADIDVLAIADLPYRTGPDSQHAQYPRELFERMYRDGFLARRSLLHKRALDVLLRFGAGCNMGRKREMAFCLAALRERFGDLPKIAFYDHHLAHAAAVYFTSRSENATVVTADGRGGIVSTALWHGSGNDLTLLRAEPFYNSLGLFYRECTLYLGLGEFAEGKLMGLASYGSPRPRSEEIAGKLDTRATPWYETRTAGQPFTFEFARRISEPILNPPYPDFASAVQTAFETAISRIVQWGMQVTGSGNICAGGGAFLNCSSNGRLRNLPGVRSMYVFPAAGDNGLSVGAALMHAARTGHSARQQMTNAYYGPEFSDSECEAALRSISRLQFHRAKDLVEEAACRLAGGQTCGWFQGRMELGPRALGGRSILADPRTVEMRDRVNLIKQREMWRPLAPVVLANRARDFFEINGESPFMLFAYPVRPEKRCLIPAAVHIDGSARPQTVTAEQNSRLYSLLLAFERRSGVPVLINTSFNTAGEPIVCTPADAVKTFLNSPLEFLALGNFIVEKRPNPS